jgi:hypothetical protein
MALVAQWSARAAVHVVGAAGGAGAGGQIAGWVTCRVECGRRGWWRASGSKRLGDLCGYRCCCWRRAPCAVLMALVRRRAPVRRCSVSSVSAGRAAVTMLKLRTMRVDAEPYADAPKER